MNTPFPQSAFADLVKVETANWWFRSRNEIIVWILTRRIDKIDNFLEVGCGTGFVISGIAKALPLLKIEASEYFEEALFIARQRVPQCHFRRLDATLMEEENMFDCIGSFDVIEHIDADECVLTNFYRALKTDGFLLLTVPQHPWLWSSSDDYAHHLRRYTAKGLRHKVFKAGFKVEYCTSFVSLLLPLMILQRFTSSRKSNFDPSEEFRINSVLNRVLYLVMKLELILLQLGLRFPVGGSLVLLARKP